MGKAVDDFHDYDAIPKQQEAFASLLRGRGVYNIESSGLSIAAYTRVSCVSMPSSTSGAPLLSEIAPEEARQYL